MFYSVLLCPVLQCFPELTVQHVPTVLWCELKRNWDIGQTPVLTEKVRRRWYSCLMKRMCAEVGQHTIDARALRKMTEKKRTLIWYSLCMVKIHLNVPPEVNCDKLFDALAEDFPTTNQGKSMFLTLVLRSSLVIQTIFLDS